MVSMIPLNLRLLRSARVIGKGIRMMLLLDLFLRLLSSQVTPCGTCLLIPAFAHLSLTVDGVTPSSFAVILLPYPILAIQHEQGNQSFLRWVSGDD
jgi:hypothetical protein